MLVSSINRSADGKNVNMTRTGGQRLVLEPKTVIADLLPLTMFHSGMVLRSCG